MYITYTAKKIYIWVYIKRIEFVPKKKKKASTSTHVSDLIKLSETKLPVICVTTKCTTLPTTANKK